MSEEIDKHVMRKYEVAQKLGKGAYGIVWKATDKKTKETVTLTQYTLTPTPTLTLTVAQTQARWRSCSTNPNPNPSTNPSPNPSPSPSLNRNQVALKKIFDAFQNATDAQRTFREISFLQQMDGHENIVQLYNVLKVALASAALG